MGFLIYSKANMAAESPLPIDPETGVLNQEAQATLPNNALLSAGYLARLIPGLDVDIRTFIGVWEGTTRAVGLSGPQSVSLRIECGTLVHDLMIRSVVTVVTPQDRIRETWVIQEGRDGIEYAQGLKVPGSVLMPILKDVEYNTSVSDAKIRHPRLAFTLYQTEYPNLGQIETLSQLPIFTDGNTILDRSRTDSFPDDSDAFTIPNNLRRLILAAESGIATSELRSRITRRVPAKLDMVGSGLFTYQVHPSA